MLKINLGDEIILFTKCNIEKEGLGIDIRKEFGYVKK